MKKIIFGLLVFLLLFGCSGEPEKELTIKEQVAEKQRELYEGTGITKGGITEPEAKSIARDFMLMMWDQLFPIVDTVKEEGSWKVIYEHSEGEGYIIVDSGTGEVKNYSLGEGKVNEEVEEE